MKSVGRKLRAVIGEETYAAFKRANDQEYKDLAVLTKRIELPADTPDLPGRRNTLDRIAPSAPGGDRWWRPRVGGAEMNDLMMWWALLFGLSMLARYEPAGWNGMLDLDHNPIASHLIRLMDAAVDVVPELVLHVLEPSYAAA